MRLIVSTVAAWLATSRAARRHIAPAVSGRLGGIPLRVRLCGAAVAGLAATIAPSATQNAVANGDTRTLTFHHVHTGESLQITYLSGGSYDSGALQTLNRFLRDWRNDQQIRIDPRLFDILWEVQRAAGSRDAIKVLSAYRSPSTNAMLRRSSRGVAEHSQHTRGKAIDIHLDDVGLSRIREAGMRLQKGGVGYYPSASFVHLDTGSVRHWPRMSYDQLARLFPDGKTVHVPSNGQPLSGYDQALAEIEAGGGSAYASAYVTGQKSKGLFSFLFGGGEDEASEIQEATAGKIVRGSKSARGGRAQPQQQVQMASAPSQDGDSRTFFSSMFTRPSASQTQVAALDPREARAAEAARKAEERAAARKQAEDAKAEARRQAEDAKRQSDDAKAESKRQVEELKRQTEEARRQTEIARLDARRQSEEAKRLADETQDATQAPGAKAEAKTTVEARLDPARQKMVERLADAPAPPRRPSESMIASLSYADVPLPPSRPIGLVANAPTPTLAGKKLSALDESGLPALITEGAGQSGAGGKALAYAPEPIRKPVPPAVAPAVARAEAQKPVQANLTPPRIDRAVFRALTAETPSEKSASRAALAPTVTPLRAARAAQSAKLGAGSDLATSFGASPTGDLTATKFSGEAVAQAPRADTFGKLPLRLRPVEDE